MTVGIAEPEPAVEQPLSRRIGSLVSNPAVPSVYAWAATVGAPALLPSAGLAARISALVALACVGVAAFLLRRDDRAARAVGIYGFLASCVATWILLGPALLVRGVDPTRDTLGALGWAAFAFGWGAVRSLGSVPEEHPSALRGQSLPVRARLPGHAMVALVIGLAGAAACSLFAWRIDRPVHALFGHVVALAASAGLLSQAGRLAVRRADAAPARARLRMESAAFALSMLGLSLAVGLVTWLLLRNG